MAGRRVAGAPRSPSLVPAGSHQLSPPQGAEDRGRDCLADLRPTVFWNPATGAAAGGSWKRKEAKDLQAGGDPLRASLGPPGGPQTHSRSGQGGIGDGDSMLLSEGLSPQQPRVSLWGRATYFERKTEEQVTPAALAPSSCLHGGAQPCLLPPPHPRPMNRCLIASPTGFFSYLLWGNRSTWERGERQP